MPRSVLDDPAVTGERLEKIVVRNREDIEHVQFLLDFYLANLGHFDNFPIVEIWVKSQNQ